MSEDATTHASPRPWRTAENQLGWMSVVVDADGGEVAVFWGGEHFDRATAEADAALAVEAGDLAHARQELAQCAAVCIRAMEHVEHEMENKTK